MALASHRASTGSHSFTAGKHLQNMSARQLLFDVTPGACFSAPSAKENSSPEAPSDMAQRRFHMSNECKIAKAAHFHLLSSSQLLLLGWLSETNFIAGGNRPPQ